MSKLYRKRFDELSPAAQNRLMDTHGMRRQNTIIQNKEVEKCIRCEKNPPAEGDFICWDCLSEAALKVNDDKE